nr:hypothetical protein CFP56_79227 [Quercus suber]
MLQQPHLQQSMARLEIPLPRSEIGDGKIGIRTSGNIKKFKAPDGSKLARVDSPSQWVLVKGVVWSGQICAKAWSSDGARGEGFQRCSIDKDWARGSMEMVWCRDWNRSTDGDLKAGPSSSWCWMAKLEIAVGSVTGDEG